MWTFVYRLKLCTVLASCSECPRYIYTTFLSVLLQTTPHKLFSILSKIKQPFFIMVFIKDWVWLVSHICKSWLQVLCILKSMSITVNFHREIKHAWLISLISGRELSLIIRAATLHSWQRTNRSVGNKETILTHVSHWTRSYCTWDWGSVVNHNDTCIHNTYIVYTTLQRYETSTKVVITHYCKFSTL